jgi:hypothetical protein
MAICLSVCLGGATPTARGARTAILSMENMQHARKHLSLSVSQPGRLLPFSMVLLLLYSKRMEAVSGRERLCRGVLLSLSVVYLFAPWYSLSTFLDGIRGMADAAAQAVPGW